MIEVRDAVKKFDGFAALDGANLLVPQGSVYGLVGPNGAGKSTLIRHLTGIYRQDGGTVRVDGQPVWENTSTVVPRWDTSPITSDHTCRRITGSRPSTGSSRMR